jgi:pimeloyl-ACP methyl ester carboxylesterase
MSAPTFVFSLGAWVVPAVFDATRSRLEALGFPSSCPAHPSIGAEPPTKTLSDDVSSLRGVLSAFADEGRDLVVVAHSYGGVVASSAVEGLSKAARVEAGKTGGVVKVIYIAAFALDKGQSLLGMLGGNYLPWMKVEVSLPKARSNDTLPSSQARLFFSN